MEKKYLVMPVEKGKKVNNIDGPNAIVMINIIPAIMWAIVFENQILKGTGAGQTLLIWAGFVIVYMILHFIKYISFLPAIADVIMIVGVLWIPCGLIPNTVIRIIVKAIVAIFFGLFELSVAIMPLMKRK